MKRIIAAILLLALAALLVSCGGGELPDPRRDFTVMAIDQADKPVSGAKINVCEGTRVVASVVTDRNGKATVNLYPGEYILRPDGAPIGYTAVNTTTRVKFSDTTHTGYVLYNNITADGSERNPYVVTASESFKIEAGKYAFMKVRPSEKKTLVIEAGLGIVAVANGTTYNVNPEGIIIIDLEGETTVMLRNNGEERTVSATLVYPFGSEQNPHTVKLNVEYRAAIDGRTTHYTFTATADGSFHLVGTTGNGVYTVKNLTTQDTLEGSGTATVALEVKKGDTVRVTVSGDGEIGYRFELVE